MNKAHFVLRCTIYVFVLLLIFSREWYYRTFIGSDAELFAEFLMEIFMYGIILTLCIKLLLDGITIIKRIIKA